jgi:hypothetical protein
VLLAPKVRQRSRLGGGRVSAAERLQTQRADALDDVDVRAPKDDEVAASSAQSRTSVLEASDAGIVESCGQTPATGAELS